MRKASKTPTKPAIDDLIKAFPPVPENEIEDIDYQDEDEEEELDTMSELFPFEEQFYDEEGNFIGE